MGRKKDPIWDHVEKLNDKVFKCKYCGEEFAGGASRIKAHISGIEGKGIRKCNRVPQDVQIASSSTFDDSNKTPCNPQRNFVDSSKGAGVLVHTDVPEECILFPEIFERATVPTINYSNNQCIMKNFSSGSLEVNCLYSNDSAVGNVNSSNRRENYLISSQSITRKINSSDPSKGKSIICGKTDFVQDVEPALNDGAKNKLSEHVDISQTEKMDVDTESIDVRICCDVVQKAEYDSSNKRLKRTINSNHLEENFVNSNSLSSSSKGNVEIYQMPTSADFMCEKFESYIDQIWGWLMNDKVSVIGVCGMGGVGKSTLLKHIYNKLLDDSCHVIWIDVPQDCSVFQLQKAIAESCDLHLLDMDGTMKIAAKLLHAFKKLHRCAIILNDMWVDIDLESVGIPLNNSEVQVIISSRLFDVCQTMGAKKHILKMEPRYDCDRNQQLFFKVLGKDKCLLSPKVKDIAASIIYECDSLPLAIATMARHMRGKEDIIEWQYVLKNLRNLEQYDLKRRVFLSLALSYNHLNTKLLQKCFLHCACILQRNYISRGDLIFHFVSEGLIDGKNSLKTQFDEGHVILNKLINSSLLMVMMEEDSNEMIVGIHSLVWKMAANIAKESEDYMVKSSEDLRDASHLQEWKEDLKKVKLAIKEIPSGTSPWCPKLSTLILCYNRSLKLIPKSFFIHMPSLKVLDLSYCHQIEHLPTSVSNLEALTALLLCGCSSLKHMPSLAKLHKLEMLDLSLTAIIELPLGLEMLINLRWLNLEETQQLIMSSPSVIPKLTNLQVLLIDMYAESVKVKVDDLEGLKALESVVFSFSDQNEFNAYVRGIVKNGGLRSYSLRLQERKLDWDETDCWMDNVYSNNKTIRFWSIGIATSLLLPVDMNKLIIEKCDEWRSSCDVLSFHDNDKSKSPKILSFTIRSCAKLENVFCLSSCCIFCSSLQSIECLALENLKSLSLLTLAPWGPFYSLRDLNVWGCHRMKALLTDGMAGVLQNMETLDVCNCEGIEEIFSLEKNNELADVDNDVSLIMFPHYQNFDELFSSGTGRNNQEQHVTNALSINGTHAHACKIELPKLKSVSLQSLPQLNIVYEGILACDSLQEFKILWCPNLKHVPQVQSLCQDYKIFRS